MQIDEYEFVVHPRLVGHGPLPPVVSESPNALKFVRAIVPSRTFKDQQVRLQLRSRFKARG